MSGWLILQFPVSPTSWIHRLTEIFITFYYSQGKTQRNAGWDFSIGGSTGTGTVRNAVRPPQVRDRRAEVTPRKNVESGSPWTSSGTIRSEVSLGKDARDARRDEKQDYYHEDVSLSHTHIHLHVLLAFWFFCVDMYFVIVSGSFNKIHN